MAKKKFITFFGWLLTVIFIYNPVAISQGSSLPQYELQVDGLACPFCVYGIEKSLMKIEAVEKLDIDIRSGTIMVWVKKDKSVSDEELREAVKDSGFTLRDLKKLSDSEQKRE